MNTFSGRLNNWIIQRKKLLEKQHKLEEENNWMNQK